jgi:hypothetical protein
MHHQRPKGAGLAQSGHSRRRLGVQGWVDGVPGSDVYQGRASAWACRPGRLVSPSDRSVGGAEPARPDRRSRRPLELGCVKSCPLAIDHVLGSVRSGVSRVSSGLASAQSGVELIAPMPRHRPIFFMATDPDSRRRPNGGSSRSPPRVTAAFRWVIRDVSRETWGWCLTLDLRAGRIGR